MTLRIRKMKNGDTAADGLEPCGSAVRLFLAEGDVRPIVIDLADYLGSSDTIDAASQTEGSATVSTPAISGSTITANITGASGANYADIQATLSTGEKITQRIVTIENNPNINSRDYIG